MAMEISITTGIITTPIVAKICFEFTRPININKILVPAINMAVERLAGAISTQIMPTGIMMGRNPFLKSFITLCLRLSCLLMYMNNASFAKSEVWKVMLITGSLIQRLPAFNCTPKNKVYNNNGMEIKNKMSAILE